MVEGRGSKNYSKLFSNFFLTSSFQSSQARVHSSFRCLFLLLHSHGLSGVLSIRIWPFLFLRLNYFFSGPRIRIIAEDNANAEDAVTYRCNTEVLKQYCLFRAETQWVFLSNDSLAYEKIRQKNPQYQYQYRYQRITIED